MKTAERTRIVIDGIVVTLVPRSGGDQRTYKSKSRVYGAIEALAPDLTALEPQWVSEPIGQKSDDVTRLKGKIWRAWRDGTKAIVAERLSELVSKLGTKVGINVDGLSSEAVTFSYNAGCASCPCSPGYILSGRVRDTLSSPGFSIPADIYLSRVEDEE